MKNNKNIAIALFTFMALTSCKKVLDKGDLSSIPTDLVYNDSTLVNLNVNYIYKNNQPEWGGNTSSTLPFSGGALTDESYGDSKFMRGTVTVEDVADFGTALSASNNYGRIRVINMMLTDIDGGTIPTATKNRLKSQALFFRAWRYFDLVRIYGGVPLVLTPLDGVGQEEKDAALLPRNTTAQCIQQIVNDLDTAIKYLPGRWDKTNTADWGRITRGAAAALKGRVLLMYASPQFVLDKETVLGTENNYEGITARYKAAYDANLQAKTILDKDGYGLNASYRDMWFTEVGNPEAVMVTGYNTATGDQAKRNNGYDNSTRPSYTGTGGGSNQPSWELAAAYPMKDGKKAGVSTNYPYSDQTFYKNRDPRFNYTIGYNGATWPLNGNATYRLWTYFAGGKSVEQKASNTGFYLRKAIDPNVAAGLVQFSGTDWMEIRYAEVLLNLAESACGIGNISTSGEGYAGIIAVRKRAGIDAGDGLYGLDQGMTKSQLFKAILDERLIEFAFEGKRFWDLYRWKEIEAVLNKKSRHGVIINLKTGAGIPTAAQFADATNANYRDKVDIDVAYQNYFSIDKTKEMDTWDLVNKIQWKSNYYFFGIPTSAISNNPKIIQNNTWGGTFDPLN